MPRAKRLEQPVEDTTVDEPQEPDTLAGQIGEADEDPFLVELAKSLGYKEAEEWTKDHGPERERDPAKRLSVRDFLAETPRHLAALKESSERSARAAAEAIEDERRRAREEATRILVESEDRGEREKAKETLSKNAETPPQTRVWIAKNPWFETDKAAQSVAATAIQRAFAIGLPIDEQLAAGEEAAKRQFPHYFSSGTEQRLSDVRRQAPMPPQVQSGTRATVSQPRGDRGWAEIPRKDKEAFDGILLRQFMQRGLTQDEARKRYAESYWRKPPPAPEDRGAEEYPMTPTRSDVWRQRKGMTRP